VIRASAASLASASLLLVAAIGPVSGCGAIIVPAVECSGGCEDICGKHPRNNIGGKKRKHAECAKDYTSGYDVGFCAGVRGSHVFGVNSDPYVAGYYDGFADGEVNQSSLQEQRYCAP